MLNNATTEGKKPQQIFPALGIPANGEYRYDNCTFMNNVNIGYRKHNGVIMVATDSLKTEVRFTKK